MAKKDYSCNFNLQDCIKALGMDEKGRVQQTVTNEFMKNVQEFVPFDLKPVGENPGQLIDSCHIENGTDVVWNTPYARRHYYHPEQNFQGAPTRGGYWASRYLQDGGLKELEAGARKEAGK